MLPKEPRSIPLASLLATRHNIPVGKKRIDTLLVELGLAPTRTKAQAILMAGDVLVDDRPVTKAGALVPHDANIRLRARLPYVSRGGIKLAHALDVFKINVTGAKIADIGASTGGFTDCLLKRGATRVYAIDVGTAQLDQSLRTDPRVVVMERVNARNPIVIPERLDLVTVDVSFISATKVITPAAATLIPSANIIVLVKPQFEALREEVGKGGLIKDPAVHARIIGRFICWAADNGYRVCGLTTSPIKGATGNVEFLVLLRHD